MMRKYRYDVYSVCFDDCSAVYYRVFSAAEKTVPIPTTR